MTKWQHCEIVGCDCRRKQSTGRDGDHVTEWICRGHWSMAKKSRRTFYNAVKRKVKAAFEDEELANDPRQLVAVYRHLWDRLKREINQKSVGI